MVLYTPIPKTLSFQNALLYRILKFPSGPQILCFSVDLYYNVYYYVLMLFLISICLKVFKFKKLN